MKIFKSHQELEVYQLAFEAAIEIYKLSKTFPAEERYSLTDQIRRSSRSVAANIAEAFRKRRYEKAFIAKLSDAEGEAAETQVWLQFALKFGYLSNTDYDKLYEQYNFILGKLVIMIRNPNKWTF